MPLMLRSGWVSWFHHSIGMAFHDELIKWKHFPRYWPFVRGIHRSPVNSPNKGQWSGALMFSLICIWINGWVNNREAGYLRRYRVHYDITVMKYQCPNPNAGLQNTLLVILAAYRRLLTHRYLLSLVTYIYIHIFICLAFIYFFCFSSNYVTRHTLLPNPYGWTLWSTRVT